MKHIIITIENNEQITGIFLDRFFYKELEPLVTKLGFSKHVDYSEFDRFHRKNVTFESFFSILSKQSPIGVTYHYNFLEHSLIHHSLHWKIAYLLHQLDFAYLILKKNFQMLHFFYENDQIGVTDMQFFNVENDELENVLKNCNDMLLDENKPKNKIK